MHDISNNRTPSKISELFVRSNMIHSHYTRFSAAGNFYVRRSGLNQLSLSFSRSGVRIWNKIPLTLREQRRDPLKHKLRHKLLIKVLATKKVNVDMSTITSSYLNSYSVKVFSFLISIGATFYLFISFYFYFLLLSFADFIIGARQLLYCCPPRIAPLIVGNTDLTHLTIE